MAQAPNMADLDAAIQAFAQAAGGMDRLQRQFLRGQLLARHFYKKKPQITPAEKAQKPKKRSPTTKGQGKRKRRVYKKRK